MSAGKNSQRPTDRTDRQMIISRVINAPRELVFKAFLDRDQISSWWGPNGFRTTTYEMDVRPGGKWRYTMHGPDGVDYPNLVVYLEVTPPERLVYEHGTGIDDDKHEFVTTITLEAQDDKTKVTLSALFATVAQYEASKQFGAVEGGNQTLARLDQHVTRK